jgi:ribosome-associated protein
MVKAAKRTAVRAAAGADELTMTDVLGIIRRAIEDKRGDQVLVLDLTGQVDYLDYIVLCCGLSDVHNRAIADNVVSELSRYDIMPDGLDGYRFGDWILIDYGVLVVHVFLPAMREFYRLEELWAAALEVELR